jgi:chromosome partitioning protein
MAKGGSGMRSIAVVAQKGGAGKTTSVVALAACLAGQGRRVLVLDSDTQGNATHVLLDGEVPRRPTLSEILADESPAVEAIVPTAIPGVELIAAEPGLADVNVSLSAEVGRERRLRSAMREVTDRDVCLIDTGPTRSLLTTNVLNYAKEVIVPLAPGLFGFLGLAQLQADMNLVRRFLENKSLTLAGVFLVQMDRTAVSRDFEREIREALGDLVYETTIPTSVKFREAEARRASIIAHAPKSPGAVAYRALTLEVMNRGIGQEDRDEPADGDLLGHDAA